MRIFVDDTPETTSEVTLGEESFRLGRLTAGGLPSMRLLGNRRAGEYLETIRKVAEYVAQPELLEQAQDAFTVIYYEWLQFIVMSDRDNKIKLADLVEIFTDNPEQVYLATAAAILLNPELDPKKKVPSLTNPEKKMKSPSSDQESTTAS